MRNYSILNIVVEEAKIFQTKERAPLLLAIEIYRPLEMKLDEPHELYSKADQIKTTQMTQSGQDFDLPKRVPGGSIKLRHSGKSDVDDRPKVAVDYNVSPLNNMMSRRNKESQNTDLSQSFQSVNLTMPFDDLGQAREARESLMGNKEKKNNKFSLLEKIPKLKKATKK